MRGAAYNDVNLGEEPILRLHSCQSRVPHGRSFRTSRLCGGEVSQVVRAKNWQVEVADGKRIAEASDSAHFQVPDQELHLIEINQVARAGASPAPSMCSTPS